jgi:AraC family transcriptional regulator of adaptative response/methylated-DNA-[protein]-cysteine methyltransferase
MLDTLSDNARYEALKNKDTAIGHSFILAVTSTGIFCRPGCPARLPKRENCVFYQLPSEALKAGYRPCKRCHPLGGENKKLERLMQDIHVSPEEDWSESRLKELGFAPTTLRRQFKAHTGFGFGEYIRLVRLGCAARSLQKGESVIMAQLEAGFESASGFRAAYGDMFGVSPSQTKSQSASPLSLAWIETTMGRMVVITDEAALYLLEFTNRVKMLDQVKRLHRLHKRPIITGRTVITDKIETELKAYFEGKLKSFNTPLVLTGTDFQKQTWDQLCQIPYGETRSYADLAIAVGNEKAVRAVAGSNAKNGLALIVPCHRVIAKDGTLGGYAGGLDRKRALLRLEGVDLKD